MSKKSEPPAEPIVLTVSLIESGKFIRAGEPTPYLRVEDVPAHLREHIADGSEEFYTHAERLIYDGRPDYGEPATLYRFLDGQGRGIRRQAAQVAAVAQAQIYAEAEVESANKLAPELEEALQAKHGEHIGKALAQAQYDRDAMDRLHESLAAVSEPQKFYVKRGSVYVSTEKASRFKPGEHVFAKDEGGDWRTVGIVDSEGQLPDEEITP